MLSLLDYRQNTFNIGVRARDYVLSYQLTKSLCVGCASFYCRLNSAYITANHNGYQTGTDLLGTNQSNVSCL